MLGLGTRPGESGEVDEQSTVVGDGQLGSLHGSDRRQVAVAEHVVELDLGVPGGIGRGPGQHLPAGEAPWETVAAC